jgi:hypothetical protein
MRAYALLTVLTTAAVVIAQTITGSIVGSVQDPTGLGIAGAKVHLHQTDTGLERELETNERGDFDFRNMPPGDYTLSVTAQGFKRFERRAVVLSQSETLSTGAIALEVGAVSDTVTVTAQGATVQTASSERGGVITASQVDTMPVRGRNAWDLMQLMPGSVPAAATSESITRNTRMNINGGRINTLSVVVDGMGMNQIGNFANELLNISMDGVEEVKVLMSNYQAEYGRTAGAEVQMATKSGKREFHGLFSYFKRHEEFNANSFFSNRNGLAKGRYRFNTFNYNIGGPIYIPGKFNRDRNRLFFFWSQEFWPVTTTATGRLTTPTEPERAGNFSQSVDLNNALIPVVDPTTRQVVPGNIMPASRIDPSGQALLKVLPLPYFSNRQISGGNYNYVFNAETSTPQRFGTLRVDYNISPRHQLYGTYSMYLDRQTGWQVATSSANWLQLPRTYWTNPKLVVLRYNFIASPTLVNELTIGGNGRKEAEDFSPDVLAANTRSKIGFTAGQFSPGVNPYGLIPNATFGGVPNPINLYMDQRTPLVSTRLNVPLSDNVTKTMRGHVLKAGILAERIFATGNAATPFNGSFSFARDSNDPLDTGYAFSNAMFGVFDSYTEQLKRNTNTSSFTYVEGFVQDTWKVSRRLTLDYGLRLSHLGDEVVRGNMVSTFAPAFWDPAKAVKLVQPAIVGGKKVGLDPVTGAVYPMAAIGAIAPNSGDPANGMVIPALNKSYPGSLIDTPALLLGPRFGFAWDPFGDGKTAIRGGGGIFRERKDNAWGGPNPQVPIITTPTVYYGTLATLLSSTGFNFPQTVTAVKRDSKAPYAMNASLSVQRSIGFGTVVDVGYVGNFGRHLEWVTDLNSIPLGTNFNPKNADPTNPSVPLSASFLRRMAGFNNINQADWAANSSYHSLQVTANRRFARGVQFGTAWTWSKAMGYVDADGTAVSSVVSPRVWNYGEAGFDRTHVVKLNYLWDVPGGPWRTGIAKYVVQGWQLSGITSFVSGAPTGVGYALVVNRDTTGTPDLGARIVVTANPVLPKSDRTFSRNFDTSVFAAPAVGSIGNAAKYLIRGPGVNNWDLSILKNIPVREPFKLQLRCEIYNAFNHTQFTALDTTARFDAQGRQVNATFGSFTAASNPRIMQIALRARF